MCVYTLMIGIASAAIYSVLEPISEATGLTLGQLNSGTGYMFLAFGWGCLFWQPMALQYGKRPVYLFSILATVGIQVWAPYTKSNGQWIANKILQGLVGAPIESLCEISVTDIYFQHERGFYIAVYALLLAGSNFFAPIIAGFITDSQGWEWVLYWCAIFCGMGFVFLFFFMEETNYSRSVIVGHENESQTHTGTATPTHSDDEKKTPSSPKIHEDEQATSEVDEAGQPTNLKTKSYLDKIKPVRKYDLQKPNRLTGMMLRPLIFLTFPVIFYAGFAYGSNLVWFNVLNATSSLILSKPPYNFTATKVGLTYISCLIGTATAAAYTGWIGDKVVLYLARRNGGIVEPEHRLWLFVPEVILLPFALILWGSGAAHGIHWFGCVFAMGVMACTIVIGLQLSISYCIDSYKDLSGEAIVTVILVRNTMSFAVSYGITPWVTNMGFQNAFLVAAFVGMAQVLTFLIFVKYGKTLRRRSAPRYVKYVQEMASDGLVH